LVEVEAWACLLGQACLRHAIPIRRLFPALKRRAIVNGPYGTWFRLGDPCSYRARLFRIAEGSGSPFKLPHAVMDMLANKVINFAQAKEFLGISWMPESLEDP